jgi:GTPase SAR1 family protein
MHERNEACHAQEVCADVPSGAEPAFEVEPNLENLRLYMQSKLQLAGQLRIMREALAALGREHGERQCADLVVKLAEDRFTLAVLGQFKRGKSSLMNAIIGRELLPIGMLPLTSAITVLKYGPIERLVVRRDDSNFPEELPVSALVDYVTEKGNPANRKKVQTACVELPVPFLRRGIEFVDTPGIGSAITANSATTYSFLPECDAVLFVTSVDMPMTDLELAFLHEIREYVDRIFFVVNKADLATDDERGEVLRFVDETLRAQTGRDDIKVFPVSARLGLAARISGDVVLYEQSGVKALEETLASFLSKEKSAAFLAAVAHKALRIFDEEAEQGAFGEAALHARTQALQKEGFINMRRDPTAAAATAIAARAKLETSRASILDGRMAAVAATEAPSPIVTETGPAIEATEAERTPVVADMAADMRARGCPVCRHITEHASDFFTHWQYLIATEERAQAEFATELGFCPLHTWQLLAISSPHGASIGFAQLADQIARRLKENTAVSGGGETVRRLVRDSQNCRVCGLLRRAEGKYIRRLAAMINQAPGLSQYRRSQGVCLRHLGMLLDAVSTAGSQELLLSHAAQRFEEDAEDMRSFAMKHEALRRNLLNRNEDDAYRRAVIRFVGGKSICMPRAEDGEI